MMLTEIYHPEDMKKWKDMVLDFAVRANKSDPEDYYENGKWKVRRGASGLKVKNVSIIRLLLSPICIMLNIFSFIKCKSRILYNLNSAYQKRYHYANRILTKRNSRYIIVLNRTTKKGAVVCFFGINIRRSPAIMNHLQGMYVIRMI